MSPNKNKKTVEKIIPHQGGKKQIQGLIPTAAYSNERRFDATDLTCGQPAAAIEDFALEKNNRIQKPSFFDVGGRLLFAHRREKDAPNCHLGTSALSSLKMGVGCHVHACVDMRETSNTMP
ncbi:MAG: hypothetical protein JXB10_04685, partial [Pirellulales bacterium]|nr:hypothetical protein [Pirellulales bacterium]